MRNLKHNRKQKKHHSESMFDRKIRQQCELKRAREDVWFFGVAVLFALYATQGMFNIQ